MPFLLALAVVIGILIGNRLNRNSGNSEFVEKVSAINVKRTVHAIMERSPILKEMIEKGEIGIACGTHNITSGEVTFYNEAIIIK